MKSFIIIKKYCCRAQSDYTSLLHIKDEYNELKNSFQMLKDSKIFLEEKIEFLKTENVSLHNDIDALNEEVSAKIGPPIHWETFGYQYF